MAFLTNNMRIDDSDQVLIMLDSEGSYDASPIVTFNKSIDNRSGGEADGGFGASIAANDSHLIIGSPLKDSGSDQSVGAVYLFNLEGDSDTRETLPASTVGDGGTHYYGSVSATNNIIIAGAPFDDVYNFYEGSVFIFHNDSEHNRLIPPETDTGILFGESVAIGNGRIAISSDDSNGEVFIYDYHGSNIAKLKGDPGAQLNPSFGQGALGQGNAIVIGNGRIAIGDTQSSRPDGRVRLYDLNANLLKTVEDPITDNEGYFGETIAIGNNRLLVGEPRHEDSESINYFNAGRAHLYDINGNLIKRIRSPRVGQNHYFGKDVSIGNNVLAIGQSGDSNGYVFLYDLDGNKIQDIPSPVNAAPPSSTQKFGRTVHIHKDKLYISDGEQGSYGDGIVYVYDFENSQPHILDLLDDF